MREIKFRLWDKTEEEMIYLDKVGDRQHHTFGIRKDGSLYYYNLQNGSGGDEYILMQYTGLRDKNGKEIYEGDIVKFLDTGEEGYEYKEGYEFYNIASVVWNNGRFELDNIYDNNSAVLEMMNSEPHEEFIDELTSDCKVIGNIHENPKLLEVEE